MQPRKTVNRTKTEPGRENSPTPTSDSHPGTIGPEVGTTSIAPEGTSPEPSEVNPPTVSDPGTTQGRSVLATNGGNPNSDRRGSGIDESDFDANENRIRKRIRRVAEGQRSMQRPNLKQMMLRKTEDASMNLGFVNKLEPNVSSIHGNLQIFSKTGVRTKQSGIVMGTNQTPFQESFMMTSMGLFANNPNYSNNQDQTQYFPGTSSRKDEPVESQPKNSRKRQKSPLSLSSNDHQRFLQKGSIFFEPIFNPNIRSGSNTKRSQTNSKKHQRSNSSYTSKSVPKSSKSEKRKRKRRLKLQRISRNIKKCWKNDIKMPKHVFRKRALQTTTAQPVEPKRGRRHFDLVNKRPAQSSIFDFEIKIVPPNSEYKHIPAQCKEEALWGRLKTSRVDQSPIRRVQTVIGFGGVWEENAKARRRKRVKQEQVVFIEFSGKDLNRLNSEVPKGGG